MRSKLLPISLALNVVLGVWLSAKHHGHETPFPAAVARQEAGASAPVQRLDTAEMQPAEHSPDLFYWSSLESADLAEYAARLRSIRCPEHAVRMVVYCELSKRFMPRVTAVAAGVHGRLFEILALGADNLEKSVSAQVKELEGLDKEIRETREKAMRHEPNDFFPEPRERGDRITPLQDFLDPHQARQAIEVTDRYAVKVGEAQRNKDSVEAVKTLRREEQAALRSILNEDQLAEYNLRQAVVGSMKQQRSTFPATPDEWRQIVEIERCARATNAQGVEVEYYIAQFLGPVRAEEFRRHGDHAFREFASVTQEAGLPEEIAVAAAEMRQEAQKQREQFDRQPAPEPYRRKLRQVWRETTVAKIEQLLGPENAAAYVDRYGRWLGRD